MSLHPKYGSLRSHQAEAATLAQDIKDRSQRTSGRQVFVANVTPGGGKTRMASVFAHEAVRLKLGRRVLMVVPNDQLRDQCVAGFNDPSCGLDGMLGKPSNSTLRRHAMQMEFTGWGTPRGYCTTYQSIAASPGIHLDRVMGAETILCLDEFHHVAEEDHLMWFSTIAPLVEAAKITLAYTGTLDRHDERRIPWVPTDGDAYVADIAYGRSQALEEGAIIPVNFRLVDGETVYAYNHQERATLLSEATAKEASRSLATALEDETYAHAMAKGALTEWTHYRRTEDPQSKALVICHSQIAARRMAKFLEAEFSCNVVLVTSEEEDAVEKLSNFRKGRGDILVAVGMASEGFDAPQLTHLVYLHKVMSHGAIAQAFARVVRPNPICPVPVEKQRAYIYGPKHPSLVAFIGNYMEEQIGRFRDDFEERGGVRRVGQRTRFEPGSARPTNEHAGDERGLLSDDEQRIFSVACQHDPSMKHRPPRWVVDFARTMAGAVSAR